MSYYLGIDLGGTNIKAGVVSEDRRILAHGSVQTHGSAGIEAVINTMIEVGRSVTRQAGLKLDQIRAVGIGAPGTINLATGTIISMPNLVGWRQVPLRNRVVEALGRPAVLENDANAAAFGEFWAGAGRDEAIRHMVMLTLGTGIGTGLIYDGRLIHGAYGAGGEGGHMIIQPGGRPCACGQLGCLEAYASATNTAHRAEEAIKSGEESVLVDSYHANGQELTAKEVFDAAAGGDDMAGRIIDETARYLGLACINICRFLDPQMIVFAGGMILAGEILFDRVRTAYASNCWHQMDTDHMRIVPAVLGNDAGLIGAAAVAWDADKTGRLRL